MFTIDFDHLGWLSQFYSEKRQTSKLVNLKISPDCSFWLTSILVKIWNWLKLLKSVMLFKKTRVNHVYNCIWSFGLTFAVLQPIKTNFKISQFEDFC